MATLFADELVEGGIVTTTQAGGTGIIGDLNNDGVVNIADLLLLMNSFGQPGVAAVALARGITEQTITVTPPAVGLPTGSGTGGAWLFSDLDTFDFPNPNSVNNQVYGWDSIDMTQGSANKITFDERASNETWYANKRLRVFMSVKATSQAPDMIAAICVVRVITQASANNDYEQAYMMFSPGNFDNNIIQVTGLDAPVGQQFDKQFYYISGDVKTLMLKLSFFSLKPEYFKVISWNQIAGRCQLLIASLMMTVSGGTNDRIKDIEVRICLFSFAGYTEFQISQIHAYVDEEPMLTVYPD